MEETMRGTSQTRLPLPVKIAAAGVAAAGFSYALRRYRRTDFSGKTVLISGASRGLGLELARRFAAERANVVLVARDQERLTEAAQELKRYRVAISTRQCDVTQAEEARRAITSVIDEFKSIDILVNNAGIIQVGPAENMNRDDYGVGSPFLGSAQPDGRSASLHEGARQWPYRQYYLDWRQGRCSSSGALCRQQICFGRLLRGNAGGIDKRRYLRHHSGSWFDAHRFSHQRVF